MELQLNLILQLFPQQNWELEHQVSTSATDWVSEWQSGDAFGRHAVPWKWTAPPSCLPSFRLPLLARLPLPLALVLANSPSFFLASFVPNLCCLFRASEIHLRWCYQICMPRPEKDSGAKKRVTLLCHTICSRYQKDAKLQFVQEGNDFFLFFCIFS